MTAPDIIAKVQKIVAEEGWDKTWLSNITPWDEGYVQPPLEELYKGDEIKFPKTGRALVPGCGKGHDAVCIAKHLGLKVTAMDISPTAIGLAAATHKALLPDVSFEIGDFFKLEDEPSFELVSDYTFFQALPLSLQGAWGAKMRNIIKPGGFLVVLAFPTNLPKDVGPPFGIDENTHEGVLGHGWDKLLNRVPSNSTEGHMGRERLLVFQKQRN